jgi:hypothetical protein
VRNNENTPIDVANGCVLSTTTVKVSGREGESRFAVRCALLRSMAGEGDGLGARRER